MLQLHFDTSCTITTCKLLLDSIRFDVGAAKRSWLASDNAFVTMHYTRVYAIIYPEVYRVTLKLSIIIIDYKFFDQFLVEFLLVRDN